MTSPHGVTVWIGLDAVKEEHVADVLDDNGDPLFAESIGNDEADLVSRLGGAQEHGNPALVIDQPGSIAQLAIAVAPAHACRARTCPARSCDAPPT